MYLGIDLSPHDAAVVLADAEGTVVTALRGAQPREGGSPAIWQATMDVARETLRRGGVASAELGAAGIAFDAPLDANGIVQRGIGTIGWEGFNLPRALGEQMNVARVIAAPRIQCEAEGELRFGTLKDAGDWLYVHLDSTLAAMAACANRQLRGANGAAMDLSALCIERDGALGVNGRRGTLGAYCSGAAIIERARSYSLQLEQPVELWNLAASNFAARSLCDDFTQRLAQGIGNALVLLNPSHLVIGGRFGCQLGEALLAPLRQKLRDYCLPAHVAGLTICNALLGADAAVMGALAMAMKHDEERTEQ